MEDLISRQAAIDLFEERLNGWTLEEAIPIVDRFVNEREQCDDVWHAVVTIRDIAECVKQDVEKYLPSAELERLTDDDFETIRIHLSAIKEKLCNQHRWEEAEEYERLIERFMAFASAKPKTGKWIVYKAPDKYHCGLVKCPFCEEEMIAEADEYNYCPNCGAKMVREEGEEE